MAPAGWQIKIERSGGFAGISPPPSELRSDQLPPAEAEELDRLAAAVDFASYDHADGAQEGQPDRFQYHLVVDHGSDHYDFTVHEATMDPRLKELMQWLTPRARRVGARQGSESQDPQGNAAGE
jgi:hypothetical protein